MKLIASKIFVAIRLVSVCCNKVFLIIIKIFYCNKLIATKIYCNKKFVAIVYSHRLYRNSEQRKNFVVIELYCNKMKLIATKFFVAIRLFSCSEVS